MCFLSFVIWQMKGKICREKHKHFTTQIQKKKKKKYFHLNYSKSTSFNWQKNNAFYRALCIDKCIHWDVLQLKADNHWILNGKNKAWIGLAILTTVNSAHLNRQCKMCQSLGQKWSYFHYVTDDFFQK